MAEAGGVRMFADEIYRLPNLAGELETAAHHVRHEAPVRAQLLRQDFVVMDDFQCQFHGLKIKKFWRNLQVAIVRVVGMPHGGKRIGAGGSSAGMVRMEFMVKPKSAADVTKPAKQWRRRGRWLDWMCASSRLSRK